MGKHQRDEWQHYRVHHQHIGTSVGIGNPLVWTYVWEVRRPWSHECMRGDNWEKLAYKRFDTHDDAIRWATAESIKDKMLITAHEWIDKNIDILTKLVTGGH